jgi:transposase InsO family protein
VIFGFIEAKKAEHSIKLMCRVLEVSRSGFHAWTRRPPPPRAVEDARLTDRIRVLHTLRRKVYGSPRIWADLVLDDGERIGRKRVERLMREAGLSGLVTKKWKSTTVRVPGVCIAEDLLDRDFAAGAPNRCWVATSPTCGPGKGGSTSLLFKTSIPAGSLAGRWTATCAPSSSPTRCRWPSRTAAQRPG